MLTCNRYINLLVFHYLNQKWITNDINYIMNKFNIIFSEIPDKISESLIYKDEQFLNNLRYYMFKWNNHNLSDNNIKVLYFCFKITGNSNETDNFYIVNFPFSYFIKVYNKFYTSYDFINSKNMMVLLHELLRREITYYINIEKNNQQFKFIWLKEKLNKLKNV